MENKITNIVLEKIKNEDVKMTSRKFFVMKWATLFVTSLFFLGVGIYLFAYIVFLFVDNGLMAIPLSKENDLMRLIVELPWTLILLGVSSVFLFSKSSKTFYRIYKKPFLTFFFSILMIVVISSVLFTKLGFAKMVKEEAYKLGVPLAPETLKNFRASQTGTLFVGYVVGTTSESIIIRGRRNEVIEIFHKDPLFYKDFLIGDHINAYGIKENDRIYAETIIKQ